MIENLKEENVRIKRLHKEENVRIKRSREEIKEDMWMMEERMKKLEETNK